MTGEPLPRLQPVGRHLAFDARFTLVRVTAERQPALGRLAVAPTTERALHAVGTKFAADPVTGLALVRIELESLGLRHLRVRIRPQQDSDRRFEQDFDLIAGTTAPAGQRGTAYPVTAGIGGAPRSTITLASVWPGVREMELWLVPLDDPGNPTGIHTGNPAQGFALHSVRINLGESGQ